MAWVGVIRAETYKMPIMYEQEQQYEYVHQVLLESIQTIYRNRRFKILYPTFLYPTRTPTTSLVRAVAT